MSSRTLIGLSAAALLACAPSDAPTVHETARTGLAVGSWVKLRTDATVVSLYGGPKPTTLELAHAELLVVDAQQDDLRLAWSGRELEAPRCAVRAVSVNGVWVRVSLPCPGTAETGNWSDPSGIKLQLRSDGQLTVAATGEPFRLLGVAVCPENPSVPDPAQPGGCHSYPQVLRSALQDPALAAAIGYAGQPIDAATDTLYWYGKLLRTSGVNAVRFLVAPATREGRPTWFPTTEAQADAYVRDVIVPHVRAFEAAGLYVMLDYHAFPAYFGNGEELAHYDNLHPDVTWRSLACAFADDPYVAAYDVYNEYGVHAAAGDLVPTCEMPESLEHLRRNFTRWVAAIRECDQRTPVVLNDCFAGWGRDTAIEESWGPGASLVPQEFGPVIFSRHAANGIDDIGALTERVGRPVWLTEAEGPVGYYPIENEMQRQWTFSWLSHMLSSLIDMSYRPSGFAFLLSDDFDPTARALLRRIADRYAAGLTLPSSWDSWPPPRPRPQ